MMANNEIKKIIVTTGGKGYVGSEVTKNLKSKGYIVENIDCDISNHSLVEKKVDEIQDKFKTIYGLVHLASPELNRKHLLDLSLSEFSCHFEVQVVGLFNVMKYLSPILEEEGLVLGVTSITVDDPSQYNPSGSYIPAKYALCGMLRILNHELQSRNIRVYAVAPAFMPMGLNRDIPEQVRDLIVNKSDKANITSPKEVASVISECVRDTDGHLSGRSIAVPKKTTVFL